MKKQPTHSEKLVGELTEAQLHAVQGGGTTPPPKIETAGRVPGDYKNN